LSYSEFRDFITEQSSITDPGLWSYLTTGGLPGVHAMPNDPATQRAYLQDVLNSVVLNDVVRRNRIRNVDLLSRLLLFIASNVGNLFSANSVSTFLKNQKRSVGAETIYNYLDALGGAFAINRVPRFDLQGKRLLKTQEKYYLEDLGLRYAMLGFQPAAINGMLENVVYLELRRRGYEVNVGVVGAAEVDFVATRQDERLYVQVSYLLGSEETRQREFAPLLAISDNYPKLVLTMDPVPPYNIDGVQRLPVEDFLLNKS
jgi:predicted AAA+ superfamily ATPase